MAVMNIREAISQTLHDAMDRDPSVILLGEDVVGGAGTAGGQEAIGGIWGTSGGLFAKFGADRVIDTPISESAIIGAAAGAALAGMRPVAELMFADFIGVCADQLINQIAKFRYMFGGKARCPVVVRLVYGAGMNTAAQHSQAFYNLLTAIPGLKVALPSTAADAKGLLNEALCGDDPVMFFEHKTLYTKKGEVPDGLHRVPFGQARLVREGASATVVAMGRMVTFAEKAADKLAEDGIECEIIDLRTTSPMDLASLSKTGRLVVVDECPPRCNVANDIAALAVREGFKSLKAPVATVTAPHSPIPFAPELERAYVPSPGRIDKAVRHVVSWS
jgi:acetoin:2,6-dichlorophenolindophenol oxidoreductase subunit beta